jgi:arylsulfatase B
VSGPCSCAPHGSLQKSAKARAVRSTVKLVLLGVVAGLAACATGGPSQDSGLPESGGGSGGAGLGGSGGSGFGGGAAAGGGAGGGGIVDGGRPNILLVIADDMGVDVSPCYAVGAGNLRPAMPTLSALCTAGVVFDNFWAAPECSPTRARLLTGRSSSRTGVGSAGDSLATNWPTLQQALKPTYSNAVIGKWHLGGGMVNLSQPTTLGVEFYQGLWTGALQSYTNWTQTRRDGSQVNQTKYATSVFSDDAIAWLGSQTRPWFLWLAYTAPHSPFHLPPAGLHTSNLALSGTAADIQSQPLPYYLASLEALDFELGRVLGALSPTQRQETVVVFVGDNGTPSQVAQAPYTRSTAKGSLNEGGIHVPLIISGAGVTRLGGREPGLFQLEDLMATLAELGGAPVTAVDGVSFTSALTGAAPAGRAIVFSEFFRGNGNSANDDPATFGWTVRNSRYQFVHYDGNARRALFDLSVDPAGLNDLLAASPSSTTLQLAADLEDAGVSLRK